MCLGVERLRILGWILLSLSCLGSPTRAANTLPTDTLGADLASKKAACAKLAAALAINPKDNELRVQMGAILCDMGAEGDEKAADEAHALFKAMYAESPKDPEARAFYGNACVIEAKYAFFLFKLDWTDKGFAHLDAAVAAAPEVLSIRLIRALNSAQVPGILGRDKVAREDFAWLMRRQTEHPEDFDPGLLRALYYYAGKYAMEHDESRSITLLTQAAEVPGTSPLSDKIQSTLKEARTKFRANESTNPATPHK
jgi:hypothetical protein